MYTPKSPDDFETAEENKPCIVFIDEIDAIGASRSNSHGRNDERDQTLNQLLTMMDGFQTKDGIMVLKKVVSWFPEWWYIGFKNDVMVFKSGIMVLENGVSVISLKTQFV